MGRTKIHLRDLSLPELEAFVAGHDMPSYRYRQIASWLYAKVNNDFAAMTDLPLAYRDRLREQALVLAIRPRAAQVSKLDGTQKHLFELDDGSLVESVLMRHSHGITLCVSSQVGCPLDCVFCQTGKGVFSRNLTCGEILDQICYLKGLCRDEVEKVNVVFMGMGEPLMNYAALTRAIRTLNDERGLDMGSRRITVSTAGLPRRMRELADDDVRCSLALSLNATTDDARRRLMPAVSGHSIDELLEAAVYFHQKTRRRVTLEYVLLKGVNTSTADAGRLGRLSRRGPFKINLIPYNPGREDPFETISDEEIDRFIHSLLPYDPTVTVRRSRGPDIDAACGQLWTATLKGKRKPAKGT